MTRPFSLLPTLLLAVTCLAATPATSAATKVQTSGQQYRIDKTPAWVQREPAATATLPPPTDAPVETLLTDTQVNLLDKKPVSYFRQKNLVLERAGLEGVSTVKIRFNPSYEELALHEIAVFRDGKRHDRLTSARIDLVQRERRLDAGVYDEEVEAIIALPDVRVGDAVEVAYTITGANPIFGGKFSYFLALNRDQPVARLTLRIRHPAGRPLSHRVHGSDVKAEVTTERGITTLRVRADNLPRVRTEEMVPPWFSMYPMIAVSEWTSWDEVRNWAAGLYSVPADLPPELDAVAASIMEAGRTPEDRAALALSWVQNEIRYYSITVGTSSHRPNHPGVTLKQRFGDCKDKSLLLSALLGKVGVDARPALVSSQIRQLVADLLPTPQAFDHAITQARIGDREYWLDGTRTHQGRSLATLGFTPFGRALVAAEAAPGEALAEVIAPAGYINGTDVVETFWVRKYGDPAVLVLRETFSGATAEWARSEIAASGLTRMVESLQSDLGRDYPNLKRSGEATLADDPGENRVTLVQEFSVPQMFAYEPGRVRVNTTYARSIIPWIRFPGAPDRRFPMALPHPATLTHRIVIETPNQVFGKAPPPEGWQDRHYMLGNRWTVEDKRITIDFSVRSLGDHVAAADFAQFSEKFRNASALLFQSPSIPLFDSERLRGRLAILLKRANIDFANPDQLDAIHQKLLKDYAVADESINSNLLAGPLLAKAYQSRAEAASQTGMRNFARADAERAVELDPSDAALLLLAEIQIYGLDYEEGLKTLERLGADRNKASTHIDAGMALYYLGRYGDAEKRFSQAADMAGGDELPYALLWLAISTRRAGGSPATAIAPYRKRLSGAWPADALSAVLGELDADRLVAAAKQDVRESRLRLCEAYFFLGQKALLEDNAAAAANWFDKSVSTKAIMYREHTFAQQELRRLAAR